METKKHQKDESKSERRDTYFCLEWEGLRRVFDTHDLPDHQMYDEYSWVHGKLN